MKRYLIALFLFIGFQVFGSEFISARITNDLEVIAQKSKQTEHQNSLILELVFHEVLLPVRDVDFFDLSAKGCQLEGHIEFPVVDYSQLPFRFSSFIFKEILFNLLFPKHFFF
ncbi:hypothetical protein [Namhaeicola litoreus]|uniref:Uncharacterized protein n=1 Tax=Namhaeicola litoreus TaxID=1052145 RepID=A0ABW3Y3D8_9FLAO